MLLPAYRSGAAAVDPAAVEQAAAALRCGALLGLPTETVYGLGADADNASAVAAVFTAKGRPSGHPLIVHVAAFDGAMPALVHYAARVPPMAQQLMSAFWPGALTLILPRRDGVAAAAAGGQNAIGLRCPAHPVAQAVLAALRHPPAGERVVWGVAAPSANRFGRVSPTTAAHVQEELDASVPGGLLILDGGACDLGIESTIVDCTRDQPVLLRPGSIGVAQLEAACGRRVLSVQEALRATGLEAPRASGTLESHYAPQARVRLMPAAELQRAIDLLAPDLGKSASSTPALAVYARSALRQVPRQIVQRRMPDDAALAAHELFATLRALDHLQVRLIWVETPPDAPDWAGVRDRLQRASA